VAVPQLLLVPKGSGGPSGIVAGRIGNHLRAERVANGTRDRRIGADRGKFANAARAPSD
jgi:hypothetical protein